MASSSDDPNQLRRIIQRLDEKHHLVYDELQSTKAENLILSEQLERKTVEVDSLQNRLDRATTDDTAEPDETTHKCTDSDLSLRNKTLELALIKLREESLDKELELNEQLASLEADNAELVKKIDLLSGSEAIVSDLTLKNEDLIRLNTELAKNITELEELESINQELLDGNSTMEAQLNNEILRLNHKITEKDSQIAGLNAKIQKLDSTILRQQSQSPSGIDYETCLNCITQASELSAQELASVNQPRSKIRVTYMANLGTVLSSQMTNLQRLDLADKYGDVAASARYLSKVGHISNDQLVQLEALDVPTTSITLDSPLEAREALIYSLSRLNNKLNLAIAILNKLGKTGPIGLQEKVSVKLTELVALRDEFGIDPVEFQDRGWLVFLQNLINNHDDLSETDLIEPPIEFGLPPVHKVSLAKPVEELEVVPAINDDLLATKVDLLQAKLSKLQVSEQQLVEVSDSLSKETSLNRQLEGQVNQSAKLKRELEEQLAKYSKTIESVGLDTNADPTPKHDLRQELARAERERLLDSIAQQRAVINRLTNPGVDQDFSWLQTNTPNIARDPDLSHRVNELFILCNQFRVLPPESRQTTRDYLSAMEEKMVASLYI